MHHLELLEVLINSPNRRDRLDMPLEPAHNALRLEIQDSDDSVDSSYSQEMTSKDAARIESSRDGRRVEGGLESFRERLGERVCGFPIINAVTIDRRQVNQLTE